MLRSYATSSLLPIDNNNKNNKIKITNIVGYFIIIIIIIINRRSEITSHTSHGHKTGTRI